MLRSEVRTLRKLSTDDELSKRHASEIDELFEEHEQQLGLSFFCELALNLLK